MIKLCRKRRYPNEQKVSCTWLVDFAVAFIFAVEFLSGSTAVVVAMITPVVKAVIAVWLTVILATRRGIIPVVAIVLAVSFLGGTIVTIIGGVTIGCTALVWLTFTSTVVASIFMGIMTTWFAAVIATLVLSVVVQTVDSTVVVILFLPETKKLKMSSMEVVSSL